MKYFSLIALFLCLFAFSCSQNTNKGNDVLTVQDSIFIENRDKPFSERIPIPFYYSEKDSTTKGSFKVSKKYWADLEYHYSDGSFKIYINDKLSQSRLNAEIEKFDPSTIMGGSFQAFDWNEDGYAEIYFSFGENIGYYHDFHVEEERFYSKIVEEEIVEKEIVYTSIANTIGVVESNSQSDVSLLNDDHTVWHTIVVSDDGAYNRKEELSLLALYPYYGHLYFTCISENSDYYTVIVNEETRRTKQIRKDENLKLVSWQDHMLKHTVRPKAAEYELKDKPNETTKLPSDSAMVKFKVSEIEGDWAYVTEIYDTDEGWIINDSPSRLEGWTKWKENDLLLLDIHYFIF